MPPAPPRREATFFSPIVLLHLVTKGHRSFFIIPEQSLGLTVRITSSGMMLGFRPLLALLTWKQDQPEPDAGVPEGREGGVAIRRPAVLSTAVPAAAAIDLKGAV